MKIAAKYRSTATVAFILLVASPLIGASNVGAATAPSITKFSPADDDYKFGSRKNVLVATFDQPIVLNDGGRVAFKDLSDGSGNRVITLPDSRVTSRNGNDLRIDMGDGFELGTHYAVAIGEKAVSAKASPQSRFPGIGNSTTWDFKTVRKLHNVLLVSIEVKGGKPRTTIKQGLGELFHNKRNVDEAFRVASYGDMGLVLGDGSDMDPTVELKWPTLGPESHNKMNFRTRAQKQLVKMGYNLKNYRFQCYMLPGNVRGSAGAAGNGGSWANFKSFWMGTIIHELGHCLGANHSMKDPGCVMGTKYFNFSANKKDYLGWLKPFPGTVTKVTTDTELTLVPLNDHPDQRPGMRVANVALPNGETLCLSYRVRKESYMSRVNYSKRVHISHLRKNAKSFSRHRAALTTGEQFSYKGVTVTCKQVAADGMSADVAIDFAGQ